MRTILETGGKIKNITDILKPNTRLYIYKQLPAMKETLSTSIETINKIRTQALNEINNTTLQTVLQDTASIQILTINVATELLEIYENNGAITEREYRSVVSKYEKEAKRLQRSLEKYKNMIRATTSDGGHMPLLLNIENATFVTIDKQVKINLTAKDGRKSELYFKLDPKPVESAKTRGKNDKKDAKKTESKRTSK